MPTARNSHRKKTRNLVFSVEGVHGVGKTTILDHLRQKYGHDANWMFFNERSQHRDFITFGSKDPQMAFRSEFHFIQQATIRNTEINRKLATGEGKICILDRSPISVLVYSAALNIFPNDHRLLVDMYESVPWREDYLIYLEVGTPEIMKRIHHRGSLDVQRQAWNEEDVAYVEKLKGKYEEYFRAYSLLKKVTRVDTTSLSPAQAAKAVETFIRKKAGIVLSTSAQNLHAQNTLDRYAAKSQSR